MRSAPGLVVLTLVTLFAFSGAGVAGDNAFFDNFGGSFFSADKPCPLKQFPTFESVIPIPSFIDPFEQDLIPVFCQIQVENNGKPTKGARGRYTSELRVLDNNTGEFESFSVGSGKFKTNSSGSAAFDLEIPAEIFADGFESGDVSAWSYTRTDFTKKKGTFAGQSCDVGSSKSSGN